MNAACIPGISFRIFAEGFNFSRRARAHALTYTLYLYTSPHSRGHTHTCSAALSFVPTRFTRSKGVGIYAGGAWYLVRNLLCPDLPL